MINANGSDKPGPKRRQPVKVPPPEREPGLPDIRDPRRKRPPVSDPPAPGRPRRPVKEPPPKPGRKRKA